MTNTSSSLAIDIRAYFGGFARLVTAFSELESDAVEAGRDVLKLHAGTKNLRDFLTFPQFSFALVKESH